MKYLGFELFRHRSNSPKATARSKTATFHTPRSGRRHRLSKKLDDRKFNQTAVDVLYRFSNSEQFYVGAKYNTVSGTQVFGQGSHNHYRGCSIRQGTRQDVSINRMSYGAGWFITPNILVKGEYVTQEYKDYPTGDILRRRQVQWVRNPGFNSFLGVVHFTCQGVLLMGARLRIFRPTRKHRMSTDFTGILALT